MKTHREMNANPKLDALNDHMNLALDLEDNLESTTQHNRFDKLLNTSMIVKHKDRSVNNTKNEPPDIITKEPTTINGGARTQSLVNSREHTQLIALKKFSGDL